VRVRRDLRDDEFVVVSITPVAQKVTGPAMVVVLIGGSLVAVANTWSWPRQHWVDLSAILIIPLIVLAGRVAKWRSRRITVTSQRILEVGGVLQKHRGSLELVDIVATRVEQRLVERLSRRGHVVVELSAGAFVLERVRRPDALARVIDHQRSQLNRRASDQLDRADELSEALEAGLLTNEEYDQRWRHLFGPEGPRG
jgi:uncharacterized membrane protein YdbT with pleckstrin-like domain